MRGNGFGHSWEKECKSEAAMAHVTQVAREYARDRAYREAMIRVLDDDGNEVAMVPVTNISR
jgi:hypothetical protein